MERLLAATTTRGASRIRTLLPSECCVFAGVLMSHWNRLLGLQGGSFVQGIKFSTGEVAGGARQRRDYRIITCRNQEGSLEISSSRSGKAEATEQLWRKFFADPSRWWDNRFNKGRPRCPDFVHSTTKEALWVDDWFNPSWLETELYALEQHPACRVRALYRQDSALNCRRTSDRLEGRENHWNSFGALRQLCGMGQLNEAIRGVDDMIQHEAHLSKNIFSCLLQACIDMKDLRSGWAVHSLIVKSGLESKTFLGSKLIHMFAVCECLLEANRVFKNLPTPNVFAWSAIILANANLGESEHAIKLYSEMKESSVQPDGHVFAAVLKACASEVASAEGKLIHLHIICSGFDCDVFVVNSLVDTYAKCGCLKDAYGLIEKFPKGDVVTWSALISGYSQQGYGQEALKIFQLMQKRGVEPDHVTFASILNGCSSPAASDQGYLIHAQAVRSGKERDDFVGSNLVNMYCSTGRLRDGYKVFEKICKGSSVVVWNAMIAGYAACGHGQEAFGLFKQMQNKGMMPDKITFLSLLKECASLNHGKVLHANIMESAFDSDNVVGSALVDMHSKCGSLDDARNVFDNLLEHDVVTWSAMIACYVHHGQDQEAVALSMQMQQEGMEPNEITYVCILKAVSSLGTFMHSSLIYQDVIECGLEFSLFIGNRIVEMYAKSGSLKDALSVLGKLPKQEVGTWNAIIAGYAQLGYHDLGLQVFYHMMCDGIKPDGITFVSVLSACSHMGLVDKGCQHFKQMIEDYGIKPTVDHYTCMVDVFGRAGELTWAKDLLRAMPYKHNVMGWRSLLSHSRTHKHVELGRQSFDFVTSMDGQNSAGYTLMANLYSEACMWENADRIEVLRKHANALKKPGKALIEVHGVLNDFSVGDRIHPQIEKIYAKIERLYLQLQEDGYRPDLHYPLSLIPDEKRELAQACG